MTTTMKYLSALTTVPMSLRHRVSVLPLHISRRWRCESCGVQVSHKNHAIHQTISRSLNAMNRRLLTFEKNHFGICRDVHVYIVSCCFPSHSKQCRYHRQIKSYSITISRPFLRLHSSSPTATHVSATLVSFVHVDALSSHCFNHKTVSLSDSLSASPSPSHHHPSTKQFPNVYSTRMMRMLAADRFCFADHHN